MQEGGEIPYDTSQWNDKTDKDLLFTQEINKYIEAIIVGPKDTEFNLVGSYPLVSQSVKSDIDLNQTLIYSSPSLLKAVYKANHDIIGLVMSLRDIPNLYLGDIKFGYCFNVIDELRRLMNENETQLIYNEEKYKIFLENIWGYLDGDEKKKLKKIKSFTNEKEKKEFYEIIKKLLFNRWTRREIMAPAVLCDSMLYSAEFENDKRNKNFLTFLRTEMGASNIFKIDIRVIINDTVLSISNIIFIKSKTKWITSDPGEGDTKESIREEIKEYSEHTTPSTTNYLKYAKRLFSLSRIENNEHIGRTLVELFQSDYNKLNFVLNQVKEILDLFKYAYINQEKINLKDIKKIIDNFRIPISTNTTLTQMERKKILTNIIQSTGDNKTKLINKLENFKMFLSDKINAKVSSWLYKNKLFPFSKIKKII